MGKDTAPHETRVASLRRAMQDADLDWMLVTGREHVRYLAGFSGSAGWLLVGADEQGLLTDFRYRDQAEHESPEWTFHLAEDGLPRKLMAVLAGDGRERLGFDPAHVTVRDYRAASEGNGDSTGSSPEWVPTDRIVERIAVVKDAGEIELMARAADVTDRVFEDIVGLMSPGVTERDIAAEIEYRARRLGADGTAFEPIVASGPRAALPHATPSDRKIATGDVVIVDMGVRWRGYNSDMTRTVSVGETSVQLREVYSTVARAQELALMGAGPGVRAADLDAVARGYIADHGYAEAFGHSLGHGVGLQVHEAPSLSSRSEDTLQPGMIVTIEPGIYISGWGGVRIEDLVVITDEGSRVLSGSAKKLVAV